MKAAKQKPKNDYAEISRSLETHEEICEFRYKNIEKRLDSGSDKFARLQNMIIGLYVLIISAQVIAEVM